MKRFATPHRLSKEQKAQIISQLQQKIQNTDCLVLTTFKGLNIEEASQLKRKLRQYGAEFKVVRNKFLMMALEKLSLNPLINHIKGSTGIVICDNKENVCSVLKTLVDFSKENTKLQYSAGYVYKNIVDSEKITEISKLPSKQELCAQLIMLLKTNMYKLCNVLNSPVVSLVNILNQIKDKHSRG